MREAHARITREYEAVHLKEALELALTEVRDANRRFHEAKPWQASDADRAKPLYETLWTVKACAIWLSPVLPFSSAALFRMLGYSDGPSPGDWEAALVPVEPDQPLGEVKPLFPRREPAGEAAPPTTRPAAPLPPGGPTPPPTSALPAAALSIRAAVIREVHDHPSADRLYVLTLDLGEPAPRTVVAGVKPFYTPDQLIGRHVVLLANLAPKTIRKVSSQGMVLAGEAGERVTLLSAPESV
ncbi:MAG: hypothetical protein L3J96_07830, partial [Thermoplasmata archaeon]|nr:hypothetical protein [Thermoplasmata archaeon]